MWLRGRRGGACWCDDGDGCGEFAWYKKMRMAGLGNWKVDVCFRLGVDFKNW